MATSYDINDPKISLAIEKWNALSRAQKVEFGDRIITHESNLEAWDRDFGDLSGWKMELVVKNILNCELPGIMIY